MQHVLFVRTVCPACDQLKGLLRQHGLSVPQDRNIDHDPAAMAEVQRLGLRSVPALVVYGPQGPQTVVGVNAIFAFLRGA